MRRLLRWRTVQCLAVLFCAWHLYRHHFNSAPSKRTKTITRSKVVADDDGGSAHESDNESTEGRAKSFRRPRAAKNRRPNILFILADDLGNQLLLDLPQTCSKGAGFFTQTINHTSTNRAQLGLTLVMLWARSM